MFVERNRAGGWSGAGGGRFFWFIIIRLKLWSLTVKLLTAGGEVNFEEEWNSMSTSSWLAEDVVGDEVDVPFFRLIYLDI